MEIGKLSEALLPKLSQKSKIFSSYFVEFEILAPQELQYPLSVI